MRDWGQLFVPSPPSSQDGGAENRHISGCEHFQSTPSRERSCKRQGALASGNGRMWPGRLLQCGPVHPGPSRGVLWSQLSATGKIPSCSKSRETAQGAFQSRCLLAVSRNRSNDHVQSHPGTRTAGCPVTKSLRIHLPGASTRWPPSVRSAGERDEQRTRCPPASRTSQVQAWGPAFEEQKRRGVKYDPRYQGTFHLHQANPTRDGSNSAKDKQNLSLPQRRGDELSNK